MKEHEARAQLQHPQCGAKSQGGPFAAIRTTSTILQKMLPGRRPYGVFCREDRI